MSDITPEKIREFLDLKLDKPNDSGEATARGYLLRLLGDVWTDGEGFNGKRPFGNSSWEYDLYTPMLRAGLVKGKLDSDGYVDQLDTAAADQIVHAAIVALDAPQAAAGEDAPGNEPAKVIVVTAHGGRERHYAASGWDAEEAVDVTLDGEVIATYPPGAWTRIHREGATLPDVTARKLSLAMQALREIGATVLEGGDKRVSVVRIARDMLEQIAELDL